jgi:YD repeat-containing protein
MKPTRLNTKLLSQMNCCTDGLEFFTRNKLNNFPIASLYEVCGDYCGYISWINNHVQSTKLDDNGNIKFCNGIEYEYDAVGNLLYSNSENNVIVKYRYNSNNNLIHRMDSSDSHLIDRRYYYDKNGNNIKTIITETLANTKQIKYKTVKTYDEFNRILTVTSNNKTTIHSYDDSTNTTYTTYVNGDMEISRFNQNQVCIEKIEIINGVKYRNQFDDNGNLTHTVNLATDEHIWYSYDDHNNKINSTNSKNHHVIMWEYDQNDNLTYYIDTEKNKEFEVISEFYPDGQLKRYNHLELPFFEK